MTTLRTADDTWEALGELADNELLHVLTKLFDVYYAELKQNPGNPAAAVFFDRLARAVTQTGQCNLNRR